MKKDKFKILVLSDLSIKTGKVLKTTAQLAILIGAEIEIFNVKKPTDIVGVDNQLSAMRSINSEHSITDNKFRKLIGPIKMDYGVDIKYSFAFGNVKDEIAKYIEVSKPDIIVIGKRKYNSLNFIGDNITEFLLDSSKGSILILSDKDSPKFGEKFSLGVLNGLRQSFNFDFSESLMLQVQPPVKSFRFSKTNDVSQRKIVSQNVETVEYVFEHNDGAIKNLSTYLSKNNVDLFCVYRGNEISDDEKNLKTSEVKNIINKTKVSILVSGELNSVSRNTI